MTYFLTSSTCLWGEEDLNPANGLIEELHRAIKSPAAGLFICSDPDSHAHTDGFARSVGDSFVRAGFTFTKFAVLDGRNPAQAPELVAAADVIVLAGGHVPTQNRFFGEIHLRELLKDYQGVLVGISAGTMNSAETVYAQPELEGEAVSGDYQRFLPGLGITKTMILPHYQMVKDTVLDGLRAFEDVTYPDSMGRRFYALVDGSYLLGRNGKEELRGEVYLIQDGTLRQLSRENEIVPLHV